MNVFGENRDDHRQIIYDAWYKYENQLLLEPLEQQILTIILEHQEYKYIFSNKEKYFNKDYLPALDETNPFLHFSLHLAVIDQVQIDKPHGIRALYKQALQVFKDSHEAAHCIMNSFAIELNETMQHSKSFNEKAYFKRIKIALKNKYW